MKQHPTRKQMAITLDTNTQFHLGSIKNAHSIFSGKQTAHVYSRVSSPTTEKLEAMIADNEGVHPEDCLVTASGMAAISYCLLSLCKPGDHLIAQKNLYGGTTHMITEFLNAWQVTYTFVDFTNLESVVDAIQDNTVALFTETISNGLPMRVLDITSVKNLAQEYQIPLVVDATTSAGLIKPIEWGADVVVYSLTKWYSGHGTALGGCVIASPSTDWKHSRNSSIRDCPYTHIDFTRIDQGNSLIAKIRKTLVFCLGSSMSADTAYHIAEGMKTLDVRMAHIEKTTSAIAHWLSQQSAIQQVDYPGLSNHPSYDCCQTYGLQGGPLMYFSLTENTQEAAEILVANLKHIHHAVSIGANISLITHPASTTHYGIDLEDFYQPSTLRLSIGLDSESDLIQDFNEAFRHLHHKKAA